MAEAILSSLAETIIRQLGKTAVKEIALFWGIEDELRQLEGTISTIKSVLVYAEKQQLHDEQIKTWLERLEDVVYEADDLADEFSTEALRRQVMTRNTMAKQVRIFCSSSNRFAFRHKMGKKMRDIRKKLDAIGDDRKFHLEKGLQDTQVVVGEWKEHSFEREENIVGRNAEKIDIKKRLFDLKADHENIGIISIVGVGGLGKTTLAQLVINDGEVKDHFELIMWVNVPKVFDVELIVKEIVKSGEKDPGSIENIPVDRMQKDLQEKIRGKLYLLVLDDVWDIENREKWLKLENLLRDGASGSRIIVTTRDEMVARTVNGRKEWTYNLKTLNEEKAWPLFKKLAFVQGQEPNDRNLVEIGKEIMRKCGGIPLVIRTIGSMLYSINLEEWSSFKEKELSAISQYDNDIIPRLKLSYDRLPSHLKHCFSYCSLFSKNHVINVQMLINLWMAQGFIKLSNQNQCLEDMGYQHFKDLLYRSFFEAVETDDFLNVTKCKMHDCMHDLATSVTGTKGLLLSLNDERIDERTRHVSLNFSFDLLQQFPNFLVKTKKIRTILLLNQYLSTRRILDKSILSFKMLRTLDLHRAHLQIIPKYIGKLKHLRYLDLSVNQMEVLPNSITRLQNLQTLNLSHCWRLRALPRDITKLVNLRHLYTEYWGLTHLPHGLGRLTNLQTLPVILLREDSAHGGQLNELKNLNNLRGKLKIVVDKDGIESTGADLKNKEYIQSLELSFWSRMGDDCEDLVPHPNLKELSIKGDYVSDVLLNCVGSLHNLVKFELWAHKECRYLASFNHLPCLKVLKMRDLPALDYISSDDNLLSSSLPFFPSLQQLSLDRIPNLKGWWKSDDAEKKENARILPFFPRLSKLSIMDCPNLISMPHFPYLQEYLRLQNTSIKPFQETLMMETNVLDSDFLPLSKLKTLNVSFIQDLQHFPVQFKSLTSLKELNIIGCPKLQSLSQGFHRLTSLQQVHIRQCEELDMPNGNDAILWHHLGSLSRLEMQGLPKPVALPEGLQQVTSLQEIKIFGFENLESVLECIGNLKSLKELSIENCPNLKSMPQGIDSLTSSLQKLAIVDCPILLEKCQKDVGEYWPMIHHVKQLYLFPKP